MWTKTYPNVLSRTLPYLGRETPFIRRTIEDIRPKRGALAPDRLSPWDIAACVLLRIYEYSQREHIYMLYVYMYMCMYMYVNIYVYMNDRTKVRFLYDPNCRLPSACSTFDQQKKKSETNETLFRPLGYRARSQNYIPLGDHTRYLGTYEYVVTYVRIRIYEYKYSPLTKLILYFSSFAHRFRPLHTRHTRTYTIRSLPHLWLYIFFFFLILGPYLFEGLCSYFFFFLFSFLFSLLALIIPSLGVYVYT